MNLLLSLLSPFLTAVLLVLSFPNRNLSWLAWIAFVPLLLGILRKKPWQAFLMCWFCGIIFFLGITPWWIKEFRSVSMLASGLGYVYLSLYIAIFGLIVSLTLNKVRLPLFAATPFWVAFEYLRSNLSFLAFPWGLVGHSQYLNIPLIQMASFTGVYGVSFIIMLANGAFADLIAHWLGRKNVRLPPSDMPPLKYNPHYAGLIILLIVLASVVLGWKAVPGETSGKPLAAAVVQGNIPQELKWKREYREEIISRYERLSEEASRFNPKLIIWPEAATPGLVLKDLSLYKRIVSIVRKAQTHFLIGSAEYSKFAKTPRESRRVGNTALLFSPEGKVLGQYLKIRLVPFGEYVPLEGIFTWPEFILPKGKRSYEAIGTEATLFKADELQIGTLICWEVLFPNLTRSLVKKGADFVVNITNEALFGEIAFPYQVLSQCVFRAVENRVNLVRAANTGISCFIDPYGRVTGRVIKEGKDTFVEGIHTQEIFISTPGTFYTRHGDIFAYGCIALSIGLMVWSFFRKASKNLD